MERDEKIKAVTLALRVGEVMLQASVAVSEVDLALRRVTRALGLDRCQVSVTLDVITLSLLDDDFDTPITVVSAVDAHEPRLDRLVAVEALVRRIEQGRVGLHTAYEELKSIEEAPPPYGRLSMLAASLLSVAGWVVFAGGDWGAVLAGVVAWIVVGPLLTLLGGTRIPDIFGIFVGALVVSAVPYALHEAGLDFRVPAAVSGGLYPLLPGGLLVASVFDGLSRAPISSLAKGLEAALTAAAVAIGVLVVARTADVLDLDPSLPAERWPLLVTTAAIAVAIGGMAVARAAPRSTIGVTVGLAMLAWVVAWVGPQIDVGREVTTFVAAIGLGAGGQLVARATRTTASVFTSLAVYVLVPGVLLYLSMYAAAQGLTDLALELMADAVGIAVAIAAGIALGVTVAATVPVPRPSVRLWRGNHRTRRSLSD